MSKPNNQVYHIACAIDDSFSYPLSVMLVSCLENNRQHNLKIHLFSASIAENNISRFKNLVNQYNQEFKFYRLKNNEIFEGLPLNERISVAAYYRILIPDYIEPSVEKYLYLDADVIINGDLQSLMNTNLKNYILAAVNDIGAIDMNIHKKHSIPEKYLYFNSGVLLVDRNNWKNSNAKKRVLTYLNENRDICDYHDQDGLNGALYKDRLTITPIWNQQVGLLFIDKDVLKSVYPIETETAIKHPVIIHFNGQEKPWNQVSAHPHKRLFNKYAKLVTEFKYSEKPILRKIFKRYIIYNLFGWIRLNRYYYYKSNQKT